MESDFPSKYQYTSIFRWNKLHKMMQLNFFFSYAIRFKILKKNSPVKQSYIPRIATVTHQAQVILSSSSIYIGTQTLVVSRRSNLSRPIIDYRKTFRHTPIVETDIYIDARIRENLHGNCAVVWSGPFFSIRFNFLGLVDCFFDYYIEIFDKRLLRTIYIRFIAGL